MIPQNKELQAVALRAARHLSLEAEETAERSGWFSLKEWEARMREMTGDAVELRSDRGAAGDLIHDGQVARRPVKAGRENRYRAAGLDRVTLSTLMTLAEEQVDPDLRLGPGRRTTTDGDRTVETISPAQFTRIKTMANSLARHLDPSKGAAKLRDHELWARVADGTLWVWDESAEGVSGWTRIRRVIARSAPSQRVETDRGAAELLLDLAATHGLIRRGRPHGEERLLIPTHWATVEARWVEVCQRADVKGHHLALQEVLKAAVQVIGVDGDLADLRPVSSSGDDRQAIASTDAVLEHLRDVLAVSGSLNATQRTWVRATLRALMEAGELPRLPIDRFDLRQIDRKRAWSSAHDKAIAFAHSHDWLNRDAAWADFPFAGLADTGNPYSLRCALDFMTATGRHRRRLPHGGDLNQFPRPQQPRKAGDGDIWGEATTAGNLTTLSYLFGALQRYTDLDLATIDLRDALTVEHGEIILDACLDDGWLTRRMARDILIYMGLLSSPYLERVALDDDDVELADRFFDLAAYSTGNGRVERSDHDQISFVGLTIRQQLEQESEDDDETKVDQMRRSAEHVQRVYEQTLGVEYAYEGMEKVYQAAKDALLKRIGAESVADLRDRWESLAPNRRRLTDLRSLALWNDCMAAPMRARAIAEQTVDMRSMRGGTLLLDTPGTLHKVPENGRYRVTLWDGPDSGYDLELWHLYRDLVRPALLAGRAADEVWVNDMLAPNVKHTGVLRRTANHMIRRVLQIAAPALGVDPRQFRGARSTHMFRHAVGSFFVNHGELQIARILLHHSGFKMLEQVYSHRARQASTGAARGQMTPGEAGDLMRRLQGRPDVMELVEELLDRESPAA